jgi:hypothetical protein
LLYAESQTFGRSAATALVALGDGRLLGRGPPGPSSELYLALMWIRKFLRTAGPRVVPVRMSGPVKLVFTDGAAEESGVSCGAVLFDGAVDRAYWFGLAVPEWLVARWREVGFQQVIAQAELLPVLLARLTWRNELRGQKVVYLIDNEAVREALVKGSTGAVASRSLLLQCAEEAVALGGAAWYTRVASPSNVADGPSRLAGLPKGPWGVGCEVPPVLPAWWRDRERGV